MPRYFFNVEDGTNIPDETGIELPDLAAVRREAVRFSGALLVETKVDFWNGGRWIMRVQDEAGRDVLSLQFIAGDGTAI